MTERDLILQGWDCWIFQPKQLGHLCLYDWARADAWHTIDYLMSPARIWTKRKGTDSAGQR